MPEYILKLFESESPRIIEQDGAYFLDKAFVITKGRLFLESNGKLDYEVVLWVSFDALELLTQKERILKSLPTSVPGKIISDLSLFYNTLEQVDIEVLFSAWSYDDMTVDFLVTDHIDLMKDQKDGITTEKLIDFMSKFYHRNE